VTRIYTRTGDAGDTALADGARVPKDHDRIRACGDMDELGAALGVALSTEPADLAAAVLADVQRDVLAIGGLLGAGRPEPFEQAPHPKLLALPQRTGALERAIDEAAAVLPPLRAFVVPGGTPKAAALHLARAVCRRTERSVVSLSGTEPVPPDALAYLNRLSDLLFTLARLANFRAGVPDETW